MLQRAAEPSWIERRHGATESPSAPGTATSRPGTWPAWSDDHLSCGTGSGPPPAPGGLDLLHFLFQSTCRFEGRTPARSVEICSERTPGLLPLLDVPMGSERALWCVYRLELLFRYDEAGMAGVLARRVEDP